MVSSYKQAEQLAEQYRLGQVADEDLDAIAPIRTGLPGNTIRQLARRLDDRKLEEETRS